MHGTLIATLGAVASVLSTVSLLPQVVRTWRTRSARDISAVWLIVALISMVLWIGYGAMIHAHAVVWANALTALQAALILGVKLMQPRVPATGQSGGAMIYPAAGIAAPRVGTSGDST
jgi:MtN3 and saliva related transmembrane protein